MVRFLAPVFLATSLSIALPVAAQAQDCGISFARTALKSKGFTEFCACSRVSNKLLRRVQRSRHFSDVLGVASQQCLGFATLLTETATATRRVRYEFEGPGDPAPQQSTPEQVSVAPSAAAPASQPAAPAPTVSASPAAPTTDPVPEVSPDPDPVPASEDNGFGFFG